GHCPRKRRSRQSALAAQKPLRQHPGESNIFHIQIEVKRLAAASTPKHRVPSHAPHARLTNRNIRGPFQRPLTTSAVSRKNGGYNIVEHGPRHAGRTS